ncbi:alpha/beta fold hydrolase [Sporichthya sp.]|uniref:alpha/beta fold hydrolase n=1 Tax=Sporichthya sp. TaxID=65475 RepID=UPI00183E6069|nr:alpha/beta fold hydrolase [Sporichthya sp.]MBA3742175.1 alpha/beta fold hydrolase [Sporichthya sp.]
MTYLLRMLALPGLGKLALRRPTRLGSRHSERALYASKAHATPERVAHALKLGREPGAADFMAEIATGLGTLRGAKEPWRRSLLDAARQVHKPMLIIWGEKDRILPPKHFDVAKYTFPLAKAHLFPAAGHMPQIERPEEFAALVRGFHASLG